jgi:hypothetical protein
VVTLSGDGVPTVGVYCQSCYPTAREIDMSEKLTYTTDENTDGLRLLAVVSDYAAAVEAEHAAKNTQAAIKHNLGMISAAERDSLIALALMTRDRKIQNFVAWLTARAKES